MNKPILSKQAFWDVDMDTIDYEKNALYVIERIVGWGKWEDFKAIVGFYGEDRFRKEVVKTKYLGDKEVNFCCVIFKLKLTDFKYYQQGLLRSNQEFKNEFSDCY